MYIPNEVTLAIYIAIPTILFIVFVYASMYSMRMKAQQRRLSKTNEVHNTPSSIVAAMHALHHKHD